MPNLTDTSDTTTQTDHLSAVHTVRKRDGRQAPFDASKSRPHREGGAPPGSRPETLSTDLRVLSLHK